MAFNILIVDDSKVTRMMIGRTLTLARVPVQTITEAENGEDGLQKMRASPMDIVIADINMPVMNGVEMITQMNNDASLSKIPVVVISTEGSATRIEELRAMGVQAYVRKPFTPEGVRDTLKEVMGDWEDGAEKRPA